MPNRHPPLMPAIRRLPAIVAVLAVAIVGVDCGGSVVERPSEASGGRVAFVNANVIPMTSDVVLRAHTVVVQDGVIVQLAPTSAVALPAGARTIDAAGQYLVPGLVDAHVHLRAETELESYLRFGVTTVVAMRGTETVLSLRERVRSGALTGPRILTAGPLIDGEPPIWSGGATRVVTTVDEARAVAAEHCAAGYDVVKTYNNLLPNLLEAVVARAGECGLPVVAHLPRRPVRERGLEQALAAGIDVIAHGEEVFFTHLGGAADALIQQAGASVREEDVASAVRMIREAGTYVIPNLSFIEMTARLLEDADAVFAEAEFGRLAPDVQDLWSSQNPARRSNLEAFTRRERVKRAAVAELTAGLQAAGVPLLLGTDASAPGLFPGRSAHVELEALVESGLSPLEALAAGTQTAGRFFETRLRQASTGAPALRVGTIEAGGAADLLLVDGNPVDEISHLARIRGVMVRGLWRPAASGRE